MIRNGRERRATPAQYLELMKRKALKRSATNAKCHERAREKK